MKKVPPFAICPGCSRVAVSRETGELLFGGLLFCDGCQERQQAKKSNLSISRDEAARYADDTFTAVVASLPPDIRRSLRFVILVAGVDDEGTYVAQGTDIPKERLALLLESLLDGVRSSLRVPS